MLILSQKRNSNDLISREKISGLGRKEPAMGQNQLLAQQDFFIYIPALDSEALPVTGDLENDVPQAQGAEPKTGPLLQTDDSWVKIPLTDRLVAYGRVWGQRKCTRVC